ncbi:polyphosphate polymerase domain-containing protein [Agromyces sp. SYSU T00194]|uniref:polyphosphate polymerase domain-containing protein n=1 Tax=Agromyces chitinivorans TaxID=3158560 RepID=UPI003397C316
MTAATRATAGALRPISLDELNAAAALQTRVDRKYVLGRDRLGEVLTGLDRDTRVLEIDGERRSRYESVYFDTPELTSYLLAARGRRRRFKIRTRHYVDVGTSFLEVKTRGGRSLTVKDRIEYDGVDTETLSPEGAAYAASVFAEVGIDAPGRPFAPVLTTAYRRTTLLLADGASRATVDVDLAWIDHGGHEHFARRLELPDAVIVETKSAGQASELDRLLWARGHRPTSISKFGTGLAALRPGLPRNKWSRVLRHHFDPHATRTTDDARTGAHDPAHTPTRSTR